MKKLFVILATVTFFALPAIIPHVVQASGSTTVTLYNPLALDSNDTDGSDIRIILGRVINGLLSIVGSIALLMFVYGGTLWLTSAGNPEFIKKGKDIIVWSILGLGIIFSAYAITSALINALTTGSAIGVS